jgi:glucosamine--fructose-6-phosphate aminotransferase (isomerizing)
VCVVLICGGAGLWFRQQKEKRENLPESPLTREILEALQRLPICFGMAVGLRAQCKAIAAELKDKDHLFLLGKGYGECIAMEGALKIKEMCYLHAEGYSGGALKHGPFALIDGPSGPNGATPVICLIFDDAHAHLMRTAAEEVSTAPSCSSCL